MIQITQLNIDGTLDEVTPKYKNLNDWERFQYMVRYLLESHGITEEFLEHTFENTNGPFDSGLIDWKRFREELNKPKVRKTKSKKEKQLSL